MKARILYTPNTPADRDIDYLAQRLDQIRIPLERVNADSREGSALSELYDVLQRPAVLVTDDAGQIIQAWQDRLPTAEEVSGIYGQASV